MRQFLSTKDEPVPARAFDRRSLGMTDDGLVMGDGSILVRMAKGGGPPAGLALEADRHRFAALLSVVCNRSMPADAIRHVEAADRHWRDGDKALANLRLAFADLPRVDAPADACRLALAAHLLDNGMSPADLMAELGLPAPADGLEKYDRNQPRVPAGHGRESGQFGSGGGLVSVPTGDGRPSEVFVAPVVTEASRSMIGDAIPLATRFAGPLAFVAAMVVPTRNSGGIDEGIVPGMPDVTFRRDGPAGTLKLMTQAPDGSNIIVNAGNKRGVYINYRDGQPLGRDLGTSIALDGPAVRLALDTEIALKERQRPGPGPETKSDEPQLCPAAGPDNPHGPRGLEYENDVHARVNPDDPTPSGYGYRVWDPGEGAFYVVDDCFKKHGDLVDGDMKAGDLVDAKGPEYEELFQTGIGGSVMNKLIVQAKRQKRAADFRGVRLKWYFAQKGAADIVRRRFSKEPELEGIVISNMPARKAR